MTESTQDNTSEQMQLSNREAFDKWNIDPFVDPMSLELETLDPAHPASSKPTRFGLISSGSERSHPCITRPIAWWGPIGRLRSSPTSCT